GCDVVVSDVASNPLSRSGPYQHCIPMSVDQAGHQSSAAALDDQCLGAPVRRDRGRRNTFNLVTTNQYVAGTGEPARFPVEDPHVLEEHGSWLHVSSDQVD